MSTINLAFTPSGIFVEKRYAPGAAGSYLSPFTVTVPKEKYHRRIWVYFVQPTGSFKGEFVARLAGQVVFSMPFDSTTLQFGQIAVTTPNCQDVIRVQVGGTTIAIAPMNLVLCCDSIGWEGSGTSSGNVVQYIGVLSQNFW